MRGGSQHGVRPVLRPLKTAGVKFFHGNAKLPWRAADLIHGDKPVIDIARSIFHAFGHYRSGELLELESEMQLSPIGVNLAVRIFAAEQKYVAQKIKAGGSFIRVAALGLNDGFINMRAVALSHLTALVNIGAVDREAGNG